MRSDCNNSIQPDLHLDIYVGIIVRSISHYMQFRDVMQCEHVRHHTIQGTLLHV